jgi:hypothetical protein
MEFSGYDRYVKNCQAVLLLEMYTLRCDLKNYILLPLLADITIHTNRGGKNGS